MKPLLDVLVILDALEKEGSFAAALADRYLVMSRGTIIQQGNGAAMEAEGVRGMVTI